MAEKKRIQKNTIAEDSLTPKQEAFCRYYIEYGFASEAYRKAYRSSGMKASTIHSKACLLLAEDKIRARIEEIQREEEARSRIDRHKVERVLMDIVSVDPGELYVVDEKTEKVRVKTPTQMPKRIRNALKSIKNNRGVVSYEFNGKTEAARLLGAWNGWNPPTQIDISGKVSHELRIGFDDDYKDE